MIFGGVAGYNWNRDFYGDRFKNKKQTAGIEFTLPDEARKNMSLEQYKSYINDRISRISKYASLLVDISDEAYKSMKDDPQYEKDVLNSVQEFADKYDPSNGNVLAILHIGATKDESYIEKKQELEKSKTDEIDESWWDKRMERMLENIRLNAEINMKRAHEQKEITKGLVFAERLNSAERQEEFLEEGKPSNLNTDKNSVYAKAAIAAYRASLLLNNSHVDIMA